MARAPTAAGEAATKDGSSSKKKKGGQAVPAAAAAAPGTLSKGQRRKANKRLKKVSHASWCWYCDREFQDDKVLLMHQKSKHFRCPHCPRRLNTAGGLAVHIDQVHKVPVDRLDNTLPGRDSFDIEIYGMEGIPKEDLAEWRKKRDTELGLTAPQNQGPKLFKGVVPLDELAKQLAFHRSLIRQAEERAAAAAAGPAPGQGTPVPGMPFPPPGMALPGGIPMPPPGMFPLPPGMMPMPPPGAFGASPFPGGVPPPGAVPGLPFPPPGAQQAPQQQPLQPVAPAGLPQQQQQQQALPPYTAPSSRLELKTGQMMVYGDNDVSVEEKRAKNPKYAQTVAGVVAPAQAGQGQEQPENPPQVAGQKRARAADFI